MKQIKNVLFYSWWLNFWIVILVIVALWERPMLRYIGPMAFIAFIGYMFYVMLLTSPKVSENTTPEEKKEVSPTPPII